MENLETSPEALESAANIVDAYCRTQKSVMDTYLRNATSMQSEWVDDKTLGSLLEEIRHLNTIVSALMDEIQSYYPRYFRKKAEMLRNRPKF